MLVSLSPPTALQPSKAAPYSLLLQPVQTGTHLEQGTDAELGDTAQETKPLQEEKEESRGEEQDVHLHGHSQAEQEAALPLRTPHGAPAAPEPSAASCWG